jgi:hypothetical protein
MDSTERLVEDEVADSIKLAQNRVQWRDIVNTVNYSTGFLDKLNNCQLIAVGLYFVITVITPLGRLLHMIKACELSCPAHTCTNCPGEVFKLAAWVNKHALGSWTGTFFESRLNILWWQAANCARRRVIISGHLGLQVSVQTRKSIA